MTKAVFAAVAEHLAAKGELLGGGTIVDATLISASFENPSRLEGAPQFLLLAHLDRSFMFALEDSAVVAIAPSLMHGQLEEYDRFSAKAAIGRRGILRSLKSAYGTVRRFAAHHGGPHLRQLSLQGGLQPELF